MTGRRFCDGSSRRDFLQIGAGGMFGWGLGLPQLLAAEAGAGSGGHRWKEQSLVIVFLKGGLSTIDTLDMKPDAPSDIRGPFDPVSTNVPGTQICEHLPKLTGHLDTLALIRSFTHSNSGHGPADHYMLTGYLPTAGFNSGLSPNNQRPSHGSIISHMLGPRGSMVPYVCLPNMHNSGGPSYLGAGASPFVIQADPSAPDFSVPDLAPPLSVDADRLDVRQRLLKRVDRYHRSAELAANQTAGMLGAFREKALDLVTSPQAKRAFDIGAESETLRDAYGRHTLGQSCLMARRLVEAGVRCVTINHSNWDTHYQNFKILRDELLPQLDAALSTMLEDLKQRGLLDKTLVVITGEFGRTPRINKDAGRDHWGPSFTVALAGSRVQGGRVIGSSDRWAERPAENPLGPEDLAHTMYSLLGIDPKREIHTPEGRPVPVAPSGRMIHELL